MLVIYQVTSDLKKRKEYSCRNSGGGAASWDRIRDLNVELPNGRQILSR
jgi:hypothetical protein